MKHALTAFKHRFLVRNSLTSKLHVRELLFQQIFAGQCERLALEKRFYAAEAAKRKSVLPCSFCTARAALVRMSRVSSS